MRRLICSSFAALMLLAAAPVLAESEPKQPAAAERPTVSDFSLETLKGKRVKLSDHKGKVVLISFWASWCKPCKQELPFLDKFAEQYGEQGLTVLAINTDDPRTMAEVRRFVKRKKLKIPQLLDKDGAVLAKLNPRGVMPFSLYLDRELRIAESHDSFSAGDEVKIEESIKRLLAEKAPTP